MNHLENYYANYDEEGRLLSKHGQVEYLTTMKYIHEMLKATNEIVGVSAVESKANETIKKGNEKKKILEVGAGTGRYSIALAKEGFDVDALEYTEHNLELMDVKIVKEKVHNIRTYHGTALDLSRFVDESFDLTLVLGPMYHLYTKEDKQKAMEEAIRVTKRGGYIFVAYCMNEATMLQYVFGKGNVWNCLENNMLTEDFHCLSEEKDLFELTRLEDINELNAQFSEIKRVKLVASDGATNYMRECIDSMDDATFEMWMKYHFNICERPDLIGATHHSLDILKRL